MNKNKNCKNCKNNVNKYQLCKGKAREKAIEHQYNFVNTTMSWAEYVDHCEYFYKLGKRYGLLKEFRDNGIC